MSICRITPFSSILLNQMSLLFSPQPARGGFFTFLSSHIFSYPISSYGAFPGNPAFLIESCYSVLPFYFLPVSNFLSDKTESPHSGQNIIKKTNDSFSWVSRFNVDEYKFSFITKQQKWGKQCFSIKPHAGCMLFVSLSFLSLSEDTPFTDVLNIFSVKLRLSEKLRILFFLC